MNGIPLGQKRGATSRCASDLEGKAMLRLMTNDDRSIWFGPTFSDQVGSSRGDHDIFLFRHFCFKKGDYYSMHA